MTQTITLDEDIDLDLDDEPQPPATPGPTTRVDLDARDLLHAVAYLAAVGLAGSAGIALAAVTR